MQSVAKTLLALALGLGFLALDLHARPTVAFLGLDPESNPQISGDIAKRIHWELSADTGLSAFTLDEVSQLFAKGILAGPEAAPADMPKLAKGLGAQYYAFGKLEPIAVTSKRILWMPWSLKVKWSQGMRLRILDGTNGQVVFDGLVTGEIPEKALFMGPDGRMGDLSPLERESRMRKMAAVVSVESAKTVAKVVKEKAAGAAGGAEAKPAGG
ncbi:MAG: hypothetical protein JWP91_4343 [Fibrobacteres bacterium]|nr:hypothetical protein [Fibrobacterota bacterium]